jgi:hypothetical protein
MEHQEYEAEVSNKHFSFFIPGWKKNDCSFAKNAKHPHAPTPPPTIISSSPWLIAARLWPAFGGIHHFPSRLSCLLMMLLKK